MLKRLLLLTLCLCATLLVTAQNLTGTVVDKKTGEKLPFVNVAQEDRIVTQTDTDGRFSLPFRKGNCAFP